ncbi:unnamed protein product [Polarella glacialis]|uniref:Fatty acid desaturase domain-containing protein n=1 Tax=Polarella glacialis TaxID=89957 RepID=A0A813FN11_POLGL|nr:unnamed protein product [Polarella glacialis]
MATSSSSTEGWSFRDTYVGPISLATGIAYLFYIAHETAALGFRSPPAAFGAVAKRCSDPFNNTTCVEVEAQSEVGVVNVDRMIAMASFTALLLTVVIALCFAKLPEAIDSKHNNRGLAQFSSLFYRKGGAFTDFLNGLPYVLNLLPTATVYMGIYLYRESGNDWATWFTFIAGFVLVPLFDLIVGEDSYNPTPAEEAALIKNPWFSRHLILYTWAYVASLGALCCYIGQQSGYIGGGPNVLSPVAFWGIAISTGIASGFGIGCIHELMHRPTFFEMNHSRLVLLFSNYNQFWVEHLWGHHKRVATDEDPASSSLNEPFWTFIFRCIWQSLVSALRLEAKFQERKGRSFFCVQNRILVPYLVSFSIDYAIYKFCGPQALMFQLIQSWFTIFLTDNANYIEHYGLRRKRLSDGKDQWGLHSEYERTGWMHAWNTGDRISNWMLFKIERHPDHHVNAGRPYQILRTMKESPTYPTGYAGMFVLS